MLDHQVSLGEALGHVAAIEDLVGARVGNVSGDVFRKTDVGAGAGMDDRRAGLERGQRIEYGRQLFVLHVEEIGGFLRPGSTIREGWILPECMARELCPQRSR